MARAGPSSAPDSPASEAAATRRVTRVDAGRVPYEAALEAQRSLARARIEGRLAEDLLLLVEHEPVLTVGRNAGEGHIGAAPELLARRGVRVVEIERGGDVTYHGPGQLVGYPILDLRGWRRDLHWYLRTLEEALIRGLAAVGLDAFRVEGYTGAWVGEDAGGRRVGEGAGGRPAGDGAGGRPARDLDAAEARPLVAAGRVRKIASIGVHVSRWVTWHGFALNVTEEPLAWFPLILPCGIPDVHMTSVQAEGVDVAPDRVREAVAGGFADAFGAELVSGTDREWPGLPAPGGRGRLGADSRCDAGGRRTPASARRREGGG